MPTEPSRPPTSSGAQSDPEWTVVDGAPPGGGSAAPRPRAQRATLRFMLSHPFHIVSLGFGSGLSPIMPGTCGTLMGWLLFVVLNPYLNTRAWLVLIGAGFVLGIGLCGFTARRMRVPDPGAVVWDEIIAIWIVLVFVMPTTFAGQLGGFLVFRFFDMVKPPPIRYFDRRLKGGFGIMFDDIVAALFTLIVIALWRQ
ncbi:phosphatidylglycerophosphatase A [Robbsia sp. Bb-Pol-6]|uniref:Phosphatidylglycerophosphatase A n=1 Tax=Robbsia betulipollinis TaxID=2981849 RepID=A0ABT3ZQQ0_9BURK|nr:phosphatidylglycerophosphatase A [Robbsia betulipollinis]MCY0388889.1 phosphatidylglycerophosphatase A [Robbsia betulipollinis]